LAWPGVYGPDRPGRKDRRHVSSKSKTVVTEKVAEWERARDDGLAQEILENWTVEALLTHWLEHLSRPFVKQGTYEGYRAAVNVHLIPGIGRHRLHTLRPEHLERLYVSMLIDTTKSRAGRRVVPLPEAVLDLLRDHAKAQAVQRRTAAQLWVEEGRIFSDEIGRALNPRTDWDNWKKLLKAAGVRDGRLHDARHTAATVLLLLGVHERTIMSVLGRSTTVSRYAHVVAPIHSDVASRLDMLLWSSPNSQRAIEI
jgi:integrase